MCDKLRTSTLIPFNCAVLIHSVQAVRLPVASGSGILKLAKLTDLSANTLDNRRNCRHNHMLSLWRCSERVRALMLCCYCHAYTHHYVLRQHIRRSMELSIACRTQIFILSLRRPVSTQSIAFTSPTIITSSFTMTRRPALEDSSSFSSAAMAAGEALALRSS